MPTVAEGLLVFGVLGGLLQRIGTDELYARFVGDSHWRQRRWSNQEIDRSFSTSG